MLTRKIRKENSFLRENSQNKNIKILIKNINYMNKKIITQSFSNNHNVMENSNKDVDTKFSKDRNV